MRSLFWEDKLALNKLLHKHQIALINARNSNSLDDETRHIDRVNHYWELIKVARTKSGAVQYPQPHYTSH